MRASRWYFDLISSIVLKVFVFQYFCASPPGLRASWWHLGASWWPPGATWRVLGASLGSLWRVLGVCWSPRRSNTTLRSPQDRFKTASTWPRDCLRSPQDVPRPPKTGQDRPETASIPPQDSPMTAQDWQDRPKTAPRLSMLAGVETSKKVIR